MPRQRRRFIEVFLLVAIGSIAVAAAAAVGDDAVQQRENARRFAAGDASRFGATSFQRLYLKHGAVVAKMLAERVPPLGSENFVDHSPVPEGLFDKQGRLAPPPGLVSADPYSAVAKARMRFEDGLRSVLETVRQDQPVAGDAIEALRRKLAEWQGHASPRDVQAFTWSRRMKKEFIDRQIAQPARHSALRASLLLSVAGPGFDGGTVGELVAFVLNADRAPAPGSIAAQQLASVAEALCRADAESERQERQARLDRAADRLRLATIGRAQRAVAQSARHARRSRPGNAPGFIRVDPTGPAPRVQIWRYAYPVRYRTYYYRVPGVTTYRYYVTTTR